MAMDATPAYGPSRNLASTAISDSTVTGRALLTATDAAAARAALGIDDVTTIETQSIVHAKTVCSFAYPPFVWRANCVSKPGSAGSEWGGVVLSASSTNVADTSGETGGSFVMTTSGASGGQAEWIGVNNGLGTYGSSVMPDLVRAQDKWHLEFDFKLNSTPDAQTIFGQGWADSGGGTTLMIGVQGSGSTTKFRLFATGGFAVNSTINIDTARHRARVWANGSTPGTIFASIDGETPISMSSVTFGTMATPYGKISNGTTLAAQNANLYQSVYVIEGVA